IDFMCFPEFDSPTVFAALLDSSRGGHFLLAPDANCDRTRQLYLPDSNILLSRFLFVDGVAELSDFMSIGAERALLRRANAVGGGVTSRRAAPPPLASPPASHRFARPSGGRVLFNPEGGDPESALSRDVPFPLENNLPTATVSLGTGETASF